MKVALDYGAQEAASVKLKATIAYTNSSFLATGSAKASELRGLFSYGPSDSTVSSNVSCSSTGEISINPSSDSANAAGDSLSNAAYYKATIAQDKKLASVSLGASGALATQVSVSKSFSFEYKGFSCGSDIEYSQGVQEAKKETAIEFKCTCK